MTPGRSSPLGVGFDIVIPTTGRASLTRLVDAVAGRGARRVIVVDDRKTGALPGLGVDAEIVRGDGRGPAAARNAGWRAASAPWVAFLDDDVLPSPGWSEALAADLAAIGPDVAASQGRVRVPLPHGRRPTDWERNVAALETACWITADLAVRRTALERVGGFDERFPRAYREDADLALRLRAAGGRLTRGERQVSHPVGPAGRWVSVAKQAGNADDVLMRALHGRDWRRRAGAPAGRLRAHAATAALAATALLATAVRRPRTATAVGGAWVVASADLAWRRIAPGPRTPAEITTMAITSAVLPLAATAHHLRARVRVRRLLRDARRTPRAARRPTAVLLDRDGTLIVDVPYNGDPDRVEPIAGARIALDRLRAAGVRLAVITNQSAVARGLVSRAEVDAVNARVETLLGPLGPWLICPHGPGDGCDCRKPRPGLVLGAAARLGVEPGRCAVIGDIGADMEAAAAAGARGVLVPNAGTRVEEIAAAPERAATLAEAVDLLLVDR